MAAIAADLVVTNGWVVTMDPARRIVPEGAVAVHGDTIAAVGRMQEFSERAAGKVIDARGGIILPGLVNTHTHAAMTLFPRPGRRCAPDDLAERSHFSGRSRAGPRHGLLRRAAGLRRNDPIRHHDLLRHVPFRGCGGKAPRKRPACGPWWARCCSISPPPITARSIRGLPTPKRSSAHTATIP